VVFRFVMDFDNFLVSQRWQILELIAKEPTSPVKISEEIGTSVAYVSQQLKLLEAAGILEKVRTKAFTKGKPRLIYSIKSEVFHLTALIPGHPIKKKITPSKNQKITIKCWSIKNSELSKSTEKLFWRIEPYLEKIKSIFVDQESNKITIKSDFKKIKTIADSFLKGSKIKFELKSTSSKYEDTGLEIYSSKIKGGKDE
jgi:predicted transcriptional regulator